MEDLHCGEWNRAGAAALYIGGAGFGQAEAAAGHGRDRGRNGKWENIAKSPMMTETVSFLAIAAALILAGFASGPVVARNLTSAKQEIHDRAAFR